jgi:hypothetical protein
LGSPCDLKYGETRVEETQASLSTINELSHNEKNAALRVCSGVTRTTQKFLNPAEILDSAEGRHSLAGLRPEADAPEQPDIRERIVFRPSRRFDQVAYTLYING